MARLAGARLFTVYVVASLISIALLGLVLQTMVGRDIDDRALDEAVVTARSLAGGSIEPMLSGRDLRAGITDDERRDLIRVSSALHGEETVLRLRLRTTDGAIVFDADDPTAPVKPFEDDEVTLAATGVDVRSLTRVGSDVVDGSSKTGVPAVETYLALHNVSSRDVIGVLEIYVPYEPFEAAATNSKRQLTSALAVGLLALWLVLAVVTRSVTQRLRRSAEDNDWLAHHDPLTELPNRSAFTEHVSSLWADDEPLLVAFADIDRFREVNETLGHANGDVLLVQLAERIREAMTSGAMIARLGGDQFGIVTSAASPSTERDLLDALARVAAARITVAGVTMQARLTVGLASRGDDIAEPGALLRAAEMALHEAKRAGVATLHYHPDLDRFDPERLALATELDRAIGDDELVLHYQPKIDFASGEVSSVEALVRWDHPRRGMLPPNEFIPIAESTNLIGPLTTWVLDAAIRDLKRWEATHPELTISINLSAVSLTDPTLPDQVLDRLSDSGVDNHRLEVEVTETAILADPATAQELLGRLHDAGVAVSLDDFGEGATSLTSLASLPLDEIKIDRSFVLGMDHSDEHRAVVEFVIGLGHRLGLRVVAEGIETPDAAEALATMGCDLAQGFFYCRPVPEPALIAWLDARSAGGAPPTAAAPTRRDRRTLHAAP